MNREEAKQRRREELNVAYGESTTPEVERIAKIVVDCVFHVHSTLGPGLLESVYSVCLAHELRKRGLRVDREVKLPIIYEGTRLDAGLRLDLVVESCVIVETKAVERLNPVFDAQLMTYVKLTGYTLGFLANFNVALMKDGLKRIVRSQAGSPKAN